jgi:tRNA pseudouridine55 synthase
MNGILNIDKPAGLTSHDVVARVRRVFGEKRVGHTGTLDPFATGVLVVLVGRATRLAQFLGSAEKEYEATIRFGYATDTGDATGKPKEQAQSPKSKVQSPKALTPDSRLQTPDSLWTDDEIEKALASLRGARVQVPPMYSAKKVQGRKLYEMARRGEEVERKAVPIVIHELEAVRAGNSLSEQNGGSLLKQNEDGTCDLGVRVVCSAGTYVRVLAEEIGERLGVGAHLATLRRTRAGQFRLEEATTLDKLQESVTSDILLPPDAALSSLPFVHLTGSEARRACNGVAVRVHAPDVDFTDGEAVRLLDESGSLLAVGIYEARTQTIHPRVVVAS